MSEIHFIVEEAPEGGYVARAVGADIVTEADDLPSLHAQVRDAVHCHFNERRKVARPDPPAYHPRRSTGGMRVPRDLSGADLVKRLGRFGYSVTPDGQSYAADQHHAWRASHHYPQSRPVADWDAGGDSG